MTLRRLRWLYAIQGVATGMLLPFFVPLLDERGLSPVELGLVLGASGLLSLVAYPLWGTLADGRLGRPRTLALAAATAALGGAWILAAGSDPVTLSLSLSVAYIGILAFGPLTDSMALAALAAERTAYGRLRAWASLGWAASAIAAGLAWPAVGATGVYAAFVVAAVTVVVTALAGTVTSPNGHSAPGRRRDAEAVSIPPGTTAAENTPGDRGSRGSSAGFRAGWQVVLASPVLLGFLLGFFIAAIGEHATWRFVSLRILDQGGGVLLVGLAAALPALVEVPVFSASRRVAGRLGLRLLFVAGVMLTSLLTLLIAVAPEAWMVAGLRSLDGASYALRYVGVVLIVGALLPVRYHALGQSLAWLVAMGFAPIVGDALGGFVYDALGSTLLFVSAGLLSLVGAAVAYAALGGSEFRRSGAEVAAAAPGA